MGDTLQVFLSTFRRLGKEAFWVLTGQIAAFVGGFVAIKLLTTKLGAEQYGEFALGLTVAGLLGLVCYGPLSNVVFRYYSASRDRNELPLFVNLVQQYHAVLAVSLILLACLAAATAPLFIDGKWANLIAIGIIFGISSGVNASLTALQNAMRQRHVVAFHQGLDIWLRIGLTCVVLYFFPLAGAAVSLAAFATGTLLVVISQMAFLATCPLLKERVPSGEYPSLAGSRSREFLAYARPFILWSGIAFLSLHGDRWVLQFLFSTQQVGVYAAIFQIAAAPLNLVATLVSQWANPIIFERAGSLQSAAQRTHSMHLLNRIILPTGMLTVFIVLMLSVFSKEVVTLITSESFAENHRLLLPIAIGIALFNFAQLLATKGLALNRPAAYLSPKVFQNIVFFLAAIVLGKWYGPIGVALGYVISSVVHLALIFKANRAMDIEFQITDKQQ